jgi:hypothetical protein
MQVAAATDHEPQMYLKTISALSWPIVSQTTRRTEALHPGRSETADLKVLAVRRSHAPSCAPGPQLP